MTFVLDEEATRRFREWREGKGEVYVGAIGGAYTFQFTSTGLGSIIKVLCADGTELDLTDYDSF